MEERNVEVGWEKVKTAGLEGEPRRAKESPQMHITRRPDAPWPRSSRHRRNMRFTTSSSLESIGTGSWRLWGLALDTSWHMWRQTDLDVEHPSWQAWGTSDVQSQFRTLGSPPSFSSLTRNYPLSAWPRFQFIPAGVCSGAGITCSSCSCFAKCTAYWSMATATIFSLRRHLEATVQAWLLMQNLANPKDPATYSVRCDKSKSCPVPSDRALPRQ